MSAPIKKRAKLSKFLSFPKEGLQFLRALKRNNRREWFEKHRNVYETQVKRPVEELMASLIRDITPFAPEMVVSPKISRIYRDVRFSKDKSPYKTYVAVATGPAKSEGARYYLHIAPAELFVGGGMYMPTPEDLSAVRNHIAANPQAFMNLVTSRRFRKLFGVVEGERLKRVPRGFPADHIAADYLRQKQFYVGRTFPAEDAMAPGFYKLVLQTFQEMLPFVRFLNEPIVRARRLRERQQALLR
jgi:uncharacterized protein (TIGR02453 family)